MTGNVTTKVYRITAQDTVGLLECAATWVPTGLVVTARGRSSRQVEDAAVFALLAAVEGQ